MSVIRKVKISVFVLCSLVLGKGYAAQDIIQAKDSNVEDFFGYSASIDGETVLVGAYKADVNGVSNAGAAYVFVLGDNGWCQQAKLVADPFFEDDTFGGNVALKNEFALIGVMRRDDKGKDSGAVVSF